MSKLIYIIAGEASGDLLGARLMEALKKEEPDIRFAGIGGERMEMQGLKSLFAMSNISLMGYAEILPHLPRLLWRLHQTVKDIRSQHPDAVITIDSPGFAFRVAEKLREQEKLFTLVHYVAPSVWAWRPERARKVTMLYDHLLALLPFESPYFEREGLPTTFVGHPVIWKWRTKGDRAAFREQYGIADDEKVLCVLPGSRRGEIRRHLPIFSKTIRELAKQHPTLTIVVPVASHLAKAVKHAAEHWPVRTLIIEGEKKKKDAFAAADIALAKSGTVTLELSMAGVPMVVAYRVHPLTAWLVRRLIKTRYASIVNILLEREAIPEFIQERCRADLLAPALAQLLENEAERSLQVSLAQKALLQLGAEDTISPSEKAAKAVLALIKK